MSKCEKSYFEIEGDCFAQLDHLRMEYDKVLKTLTQQEKDISKLVVLLIENDIPIPGSIIDRYIKRSYDVREDLPFG